MPRRSPGLTALLAAASLSACSLLTPPTAPPAEGLGPWVPRDAAPLALTEVAAAEHQGRIWVAGGMDVNGAASTAVQIFDPGPGTWQLGFPLPEPIHHSALASDGDQLYLVGGFGLDGAPRASVRVLLDDGWGEHASLPEPRGAGAAAWDGTGRIVYAGGVGQDGVSDDVWAQVDHGWQAYGAMPEPLEHLAATSDGAGTVYVMGGRRGGLNGNSALVTAVDALGARQLGTVPTRRGGVAAFWWPSLGACLIGGESPGGTNAQVECIDANREVRGLPDLARPRHGLGAAVANGHAYALLGGEQPGLFVSDAVEELRLP